MAPFGFRGPRRGGREGRGAQREYGDRGQPGELYTFHTDGLSGTSASKSRGCCASSASASRHKAPVSAWTSAGRPTVPRSSRVNRGNLCSSYRSKL